MEIQILHWFESLHNPVLNPIMYGITTLGNAGFLWILMALLCLTVLPKKYRKIGFRVVTFADGQPDKNIHQVCFLNLLS